MPKKRTYFDNIVKVLEKSKEPLKISEITQEIIKKKLVMPKGKTPENTIYSIIHQDSARRAEKGLKPIFKKVSRGVYKLNK